MHAHHRVFASFFLYAFGFGSFFPRLGELQRMMNVTESELGRGLIGTACGTLISLTLGSRLIERLGHRRVLLGLLPVVPVFFALASHMQGPLAIFLSLLPAGVLIGMIEVVVNLEADRVEHQTGRRIMNRSHAFWSFGFFGGGAVGVLAARVGLSPQWQLALMVPLTAVLTWVLLARFEPAPHRHASAGEDTPHFAWPTWPIAALVLLSLSALVLEGAGIDWSAIFMRDVFATPAYIGGMAVALGAFAQASVRYVADGFVERHGPRRVARALLLLMGAGNLLIVVAGHPATALLGFALMGAGTSALFPLAMSAAAQRTDRPAAVNVASLAQFAFVSFLLAPPLLGYVAEHVGIRWTFGIGLPLVLASAVVTGVLADRVRTAAAPAAAA